MEVGPVRDGDDHPVVLRPDQAVRGADALQLVRHALARVLRPRPVLVGFFAVRSRDIGQVGVRLPTARLAGVVQDVPLVDAAVGAQRHPARPARPRDPGHQRRPDVRAQADGGWAVAGQVRRPVRRPEPVVLRGRRLGELLRSPRPRRPENRSDDGRDDGVDLGRRTRAAAERAMGRQQLAREQLAQRARGPPDAVARQPGQRLGPDRGR